MPVKIRVTDLARELRLQPRVLLRMLQTDFKQRIQSVSATIPEPVARRVRARLRLAKRRAARPDRKARAEANIRRVAEQRRLRRAAEKKANERKAKDEVVRKEREAAEAKVRAEREAKERAEREEKNRLAAERRAKKEAEAAQIRRTADAARKQAARARKEREAAEGTSEGERPKTLGRPLRRARPQDRRIPPVRIPTRPLREPLARPPQPTGRRIETPSIAAPTQPGGFRPGATDRKIVPPTPPVRRATPPRLRATPPPLRRAGGPGPKPRPPGAGRRRARRRVGRAELPETGDGFDSQFPPGLRQAMAREYRTDASIELSEAITVKALADEMSVPATELIKALLLHHGVIASINQVLDAETASKLVVRFGGTASEAEEQPDEGLLATAQTRAEEAQELRDRGWVDRAPVVTVMGHVDHGKTSVLDAIRSTRVVAGEAGGITQHVSAYTVDTEDGRRVVFLDTPGHEAFTKMRARGASVTDVVILVVAADDGVKEQTVEALNHAQAAEVPIVVAVNKMDLPAADPDQVMRQLAERGVTPEEWGGETIFARVSAKTHEGLPDLVAAVLDVAELEEPLADPTVSAEGVVLEARKDRGRGPVATLLIQTGTLKVGDTVSAGAAWGKVRALLDQNGKRMKKAPPSTPVELLGLGDLPVVGDTFTAGEAPAVARRIAEERQAADRAEVLEGRRRLSLQNLYTQLEGGLKELSIVVKADVGGTAEAIRDSLLGLSTDEIKVRVIHTAAGAVSESDVNLAAATDAIVVAFGVRPDPMARKLAEREGVEIRSHKVIYHLVEEIEKALTGLLEPEIEIVELGRIEVRRTFSVPRVGTVAGSYVLSGAVPRSAQVRLVRDGRIVHEGRIGSLRRFKEDVAKVREGFECGVGISGYNDVKIGDIIEAFEQKQVRPEAG